MDYTESAALMTDTAFRGRVKVACLKYANTIVIEPLPLADHSSLVRWAQQCVQQPDMTAAQVQPLVVMDPAVQADGPAVTDAQLQAAVEGTVNKLA